jgi:hypothetical protein
MFRSFFALISLKHGRKQSGDGSVARTEMELFGAAMRIALTEASAM